MNSLRLHQALLGGLTVVTMATFLVWGAHGHWDFVLPFRGAKLLGMILVAYCIAVSTVLFQSISHNRILTPNIIGFDSLYVLLQAVIVYFLGTMGSSYGDSPIGFAANVGLMTLGALLLFRWMFAKESTGLTMLLLAGIVASLLFRSLTSLVMRMIDPNEFLILQDLMFANFNSMHVALLPHAFAAALVASLLAWSCRKDYDALALGREIAINLGVDYHRVVMKTLVSIAVLVSVATALVGPLTFLGLLASNLAYRTTQSGKHKHVIPAAVMFSIVLVVGGQMLLERVFALGTAVSVVIDFFGGCVFLALLLKRGERC